MRTALANEPAEQAQSDFLRISGEQRRKRGESEASASCVRGEERQKSRLSRQHTIVQAVPAFKYERATQLVTLHHVILECFSITITYMD